MTLWSAAIVLCAVLVQPAVAAEGPCEFDREFAPSESIVKPLMVGESGGTYYARPKQLAEFNGPRAYESCLGRNEALGIDVYQNIVRMARPKLAYFSASETAWFGLEHLNLGYREFDRLPNQRDGVFCTRPFEEGQPGMQPERIPPYVTTLNPGWDPRLPLYKPLPMFHAQKAALGTVPIFAPAKMGLSPSALPATPAKYEHVTFVGDRAGRLAVRLTAMGVPLTNGSPAKSQPPFVIVDGDALTEANVADADRAIKNVGDRGGVALVMLGGGKTLPESVNRLLPAAARLTQRPATALVHDAKHPWVASFSLPQLYFAEDGADRLILKHGLEGPLVEKARVLLKASNTDWSLFNDAGENAKCAAVVLYEQLHKPGGACLIECEHGKGKLAVSTIDYRIATPAADRLWRDLLTNMGVKLGASRQAATAAFNEDHVLVNALGVGRFGAESVEAALAKDFIGEKTARPKAGVKAGGQTWAAVNCPSKDRFLLHELRQRGPADKAQAVYFSFWIRSPRGLDDLLGGGPDAPRAGLLCYVSQQCRLYLNGVEMQPARSEPADYRTLNAYSSLPLKKGWNHCLVKVVTGQLEGEKPGTIAIRLQADNAEYLRQLESAVEIEVEGDAKKE